eukprot:NODE_856_length_3664_cov_0.279102.p1 type:complete len:341 gc:universal NODE_856_length_3664_cov_0.279102:1153-131(-)
MEFVYYNPYVVIQYDKNEITMYSSSGKMDAPNWKAKVAFDFTREAELILNVYQKTVDEEQDRKLFEAIEQQAAKGRDRKKSVQVVEKHFEQQDILIGSVIIPIPTVYEKTVDLWLAIHPPVPLPAGRLPGQIYLQLSLTKPQDKPITMEDFELMKVIGKGSFGKVMQVKKKDTSRVYAMKIIKKSHIVETDEVEHTLAERQVLTKINNPFIVSLKFPFQFPEKLYFCLDFVNGGELFHHLQNEGRFGEVRSKFYLAELVPTVRKAHYLIEAANKRAQAKAKLMAVQLNETKDDHTTTELYRKPESLLVLKKRNTSTRDEAIQSYAARSRKRQLFNFIGIN